VLTNKGEDHLFASSARGDRANFVFCRVRFCRGKTITREYEFPCSKSTAVVPVVSKELRHAAMIHDIVSGGIV
jgi:hypothetical protein